MSRQQLACHVGLVLVRCIHDDALYRPNRLELLQWRGSQLLAQHQQQCVAARRTIRRRGSLCVLRLPKCVLLQRRQLRGTAVLYVLHQRGKSQPDCHPLEQPLSVAISKQYTVSHEQSHSISLHFAYSFPFCDPFHLGFSHRFAYILPFCYTFHLGFSHHFAYILNLCDAYHRALPLSHHFEHSDSNSDRHALVYRHADRHALAYRYADRHADRHTLLHHHADPLHRASGVTGVERDGQRQSRGAGHRHHRAPNRRRKYVVGTTPVMMMAGFLDPFTGAEGPSVGVTSAFQDLQMGGDEATTISGACVHLW